MNGCIFLNFFANLDTLSVKVTGRMCKEVDIILSLYMNNFIIHTNFANIF